MANLYIDNVHKSFGETHILKGIDMDIADGEFIILVGPSGCGKSTLMNCIAGLEQVTTGRVIIDDEDVTQSMPKDRDIAMVFQSYALYPNMNVWKNIAFGLEIRKLPKEEIEETVGRVADLLQIRDLLKRKPSQLSGGQRQRVAMGRALARDPKIFLFDEPLSNLDAKLRVEMRTEIKKLHQRLGTTIVYVTHDQIEAMTLANRIAVMKEGHIQQFGTPQEVYDNPANQFVAGFMGSPSMNFIRCQVVDHQGDATIAMSVDGKDFHLPIPQQEKGVRERVGQEVVLGIRPEQITDVVPQQEQASTLANVDAEIIVTEPTGADTLTLIRMNDQEVNCRVHPARAGAPGDTMTFMINMDKAVFFDLASGDRI
ncbi:sn-glycerol-3-phosphate ABC transporter ATP-binding protein UgpC [Natronospirillum operosum]|uniref:sn-glycerol-3-phosphate ABC transporter ATP-binding protein UgpC n=1 Tax=Natronospirillum operosum TaxID=2759953 RepID=A0A4Z0W690_9GAMM|nr:sn-glycerol-3-phosphate ABC transporter ATP-binding protein UgpC [Natronospirillum operosum]TGG91653.1 sn-glycerol-3-phosphate ABC transporter ATP-binding protein UgpC [Natronospirillum operosum]